MEATSQETPLLLQDMKVTIHKTSMVFPSKQTEKKSLFLSNIDKELNFDIQMVHFFEANKDFPPQIVTEKLKKALEDSLVAYDFLAGRLKMNCETKRLEIDCNAKGVGFVVASSEYKLDQTGDLVYHNQALAQFVHKTKDFIVGDLPLCIVQLTYFKCNCFAIGFTINHVTLDGLGIKTFLDNLASVAANKSLAVTQCHDKQLLATRSPPLVNFSHPEMIKLNNIPSDNEDEVFKATSEELDFKVFQLTSENINNLKDKAKGNNTTHITSFNVITTHLWRCKALSGIYNPDRLSTILYMVDIRSRMNPPLPKAYVGNAVLTAYASAKCKELEEGEFSRLVEMVEEGSRRLSDEYVRSIIDWKELYNGYPNGEVMVSSWQRLGFEEVEYPWGKPKYYWPVVYHMKNIMLIFPSFSGSGEDGVNVIVALPPREMKKFHNLFDTLLI